MQVLAFRSCIQALPNQSTGDFDCKSALKGKEENSLQSMERADVRQRTDKICNTAVQANHIAIQVALPSFAPVEDQCRTES